MTFLCFRFVLNSLSVLLSLLHIKANGKSGLAVSVFLLSLIRSSGTMASETSEIALLAHLNRPKR